LTNLSVADFAGPTNRFAARVTSIGANNAASGKYAANAPPVLVPTPTAAIGGIALLALVVGGRMRQRAC
jgi:hypothetical protein